MWLDLFFSEHLFPAAGVLEMDGCWETQSITFNSFINQASARGMNYWLIEFRRKQPVFIFSLMDMFCSRSPCFWLVRRPGISLYFRHTKGYKMTDSLKIKAHRRMCSGPLIWTHNDQLIYINISRKITFLLKSVNVHCENAEIFRSIPSLGAQSGISQTFPEIWCGIFTLHACVPW